jgi:hypothetical protein
MQDEVPLPWWNGIARADDLVAAGLRRRTVRRRIQSGRWQEPAPGVICATSGPLSARQWRIAAIQYGGATSVLSHATACAALGLVPEPAQQHVTVVHGHHLSSTPKIAVHQTIRDSRPRFLDELPFTSPARSVIDVCVGLQHLDDVRALMGRAAQKGLVTPEQLAGELATAPRRGSLLPSMVLEEVSAGSHAASEGQFLRLVRGAGLPVPELNAPVDTSDGTKFIDALWRRLRRGVELDGQRFHLDAGAWAADLKRQNAIQATGIVLLRIPAGRLWRDQAAVIREIATFLGLAAA